MRSKIFFEEAGPNFETDLVPEKLTKTFFVPENDLGLEMGVPGSISSMLR